MSIDLNQLELWAINYGSELLRLRISHKFDWLELAYAEYAAKYLVWVLGLPKGVKIVSPLPNVYKSTKKPTLLALKTFISRKDDLIDSGAKDIVISVQEKDEIHSIGYHVDIGIAKVFLIEKIVQ